MAAGTLWLMVGGTEHTHTHTACGVMGIRGVLDGCKLVPLVPFERPPLLCFN